jgi:hypothetical protein
MTSQSTFMHSPCRQKISLSAPDRLAAYSKRIATEIDASTPEE